MLLRDLFEYQDLEAEKQNIIAKVSGLSAENEQDAALLDRIYKILNSGTIGSNITNALTIIVALEPKLPYFHCCSFLKPIQPFPLPQ